MSIDTRNGLNPCYCDQAHDYEDLLRRVLRKLPVGELHREIVETINDYSEALHDYAHDDYREDCEHCIVEGDGP